jgi:hypothetical protein
MTEMENIASPSEAHARAAENLAALACVLKLLKVISKMVAIEKNKEGNVSQVLD